MTFAIEDIRNKGLRYAFNVSVKAEDLIKYIDESITNVTPTTSVAGFRPGKVPAHVIKQKFFEKIQQRVLDKVASQAFKQFINAKQLKQVSGPIVHLYNFSEKEGTTIGLSFEVTPSYELKDVSNLPFEFIEVDIIDEDKEEIINFFFNEYEIFDKKSKVTASEVGDKINVNLTVVHKDQEVKRYSGNYEIVIGGNNHDQDLGFLKPHKNLIGLNINDDKEIILVMPKNYFMQGEKVTCKIKVNDLWQPLPKEKDNLFANHLGYGNYEELQKNILHVSRLYFKDKAETWNKRSFLDQLDKAFDFPLPITLVQKEFNYIWNLLGKSFDEDNKKLASALYKNLSKRRVKLRIILNDLVKQNDISVTQEEVINHILNICHGDVAQCKKIMKENVEFMKKEFDFLLERKVLLFLQEKNSDKIKKVRFNVIQEKIDSINPKGMEEFLSDNETLTYDVDEIHEDYDPLFHLYELLEESNDETIEVA